MPDPLLPAHFSSFDDSPLPASFSSFDEDTARGLDETKTGTGISGIPAAPATWSDVGEQLAASTHELAATGAGFAASVSGDPTTEARWNQTVQEQQRAAEENRAAMTPTVQPGFSHPLVWAAEQAPGAAALAVPAALSGPFAPAVLGGEMAAQGRGDYYNRLKAQGIEPTTEGLAGATALGGATGLAMDLTGGLAGKLPVSKLVGAALGMGAEGGVFGASAGAGEYTGQRGEIVGGKRDDIDTGAILSQTLTGLEQGAGLSVLGVGRHGEQKGGEFTSTRSAKDYRKPEVQGQAGKAPTASALTDKPAADTSPPPPAPKVDPDQAIALNPEPVTPRVSEPPKPPVEQPQVVQPTPPPLERATEAPPAGDTTQPLQGPQPTQEVSPAPVSAPPREDAAVISREPDAAIRAQHAAMIDKGDPREAVVYNLGDQPIDLPNKSRYGQQTLSDGRTIQYDRSGLSNLSKDKVAYADQNGRLNELLQLGPVSKDEALARASAGEPGAVVTERTPDGTPVKNAVGTTATVPDQVASLEASKTPGNVINVETPAQSLGDRMARVAQERQGEVAQPQRPVVQPEGVVTPRVTPGRTLEDLSPEGVRARDAAAAQDALQAQTVAERLKEREATRQTAIQKEAGVKGRVHTAKQDQMKIANDNIGAKRITDAHPFEPLRADWPNQIYDRAKAMVADAKKAGIDIPKAFPEGHPYSGAMLKLREAADLIKGGERDPRKVDYGRFIDRERLIDEGKPEEAFAARRNEGAQGLGSPEGAVETGREGRIDETEKPEDIKETPEHELVHEIPTEHMGEAHEGVGGGEEHEPSAAEARERPPTIQEAKEGVHYSAGKAATGFQQVVRKSRAIKRQELEEEPRHIMATDAERNPVGVEAQRSTTAEDAINEHFDPKRYAPEMRPMMERLRDAVTRIAGDTKVHYISHDDMLKLGEQVRGVYDPAHDHILLNADKMTHDTALHEAFHAATTKALAVDPELRSLMDRLQKEMGSKEDPEEFLTRLMTDSKLQDQFKASKISPELARDIGIPKWQRATMWQGALNIIRRALGLGPRDTNAIEAAMAITEKAMWKRDPGMAMEAGARSLGLKFQRMGPEDLRDYQDDPGKSGDALTRGVKNYTKKIGEVAKDMATDKSATTKKAGLKLLSEPQLYDVHGDLFKSEANETDFARDPARDRLDAMQRRGPRADELSEPGHKLAVNLRRLASEHGADVMDRLEQVKKMMNEFKVWPHDELGEGKNAHLKLDPKKADDEAAMDKWQARENHPEVAKRYNTLPEPVQKHLLAEAQYYKDRYDLLAEQKARNYIEGVEPPDGSTKEDVLKRMLSDTLTEEDREHYAEKGIKNLEADDFQKTKGPYFPAERYGDYVVQAEHKVPAPRGSDVDHNGDKLDANVRRFDTREEAHAFVKDLDLPAKVSTRHYMEDSQGARIYKVPGTNKKISADEAASSGYSAPKREFMIKVQNEHVSFHKTASDAERARAALEKDGLQNVSGVQDRRGRGVDKSFTSAQTRALLANIDRRDDLTDRQKDLMKDTIKETAVVSQSGSRITKNFARSQKVQGATYRGDALTNYSQSSSRHLAAAEFAPKIDKAFEQMEAIAKQRRGDADSLSRSTALNEMAARSYNSKPENMYPQYSPTMQKLMNVSYVQDMASASHLLTHQLNLHFMGGSVIGARHGVGSTLLEFNRIMRRAGGPWMAIKQGFGQAIGHFKDPESNGVSMFDMMRNNLSKREQGVIDELAATGHVHRESGLDLQPIGESRSALDRVSRFIRDASGSMDAMGRIVTGVAAYNKEFAKNGGDYDAALLYARQSIEKGLIHYGPGMRAPAFSSPLMRMVSQFRLPGTNMLYLLGRNAYLAFRSADKTTRNEAYRALGAMMIGGWALSGSSALPTEPLKVLGILGSQLGITPTPSAITDELRRGLADTFGATAADVMMDGPLSALGPYAPSFAHRVASPELSFGEPRSSKPDDLMAWLGGMTFGAVGSFGVNALRGSQAAFGGNYTDMIKYLAPKQLADAARAYGLYSQGKADAGGAAMQLFGVRSQQIVRQQEGQNALYNRVQADKAAQKLTKGQQLKQKQAQKIMGQTVTKKNKALLKEYENVYQ